MYAVCVFLVSVCDCELKTIGLAPPFRSFLGLFRNILYRQTNSHISMSCGSPSTVRNVEKTYVSAFRVSAVSR